MKSSCWSTPGIDIYEEQILVFMVEWIRWMAEIASPQQCEKIDITINIYFNKTVINLLQGLLLSQANIQVYREAPINLSTNLVHLMIHILKLLKLCRGCSMKIKGHCNRQHTLIEQVTISPASILQI